MGGVTVHTAPGARASRPRGAPTAPGARASRPRGAPTAPGARASRPRGAPTAPGARASRPRGAPTAPGARASRPRGAPSARAPPWLPCRRLTPNVNRYHQTAKSAQPKVNPYLHFDIDHALNKDEASKIADPSNNRNDQGWARKEELQHIVGVDRHQDHPKNDREQTKDVGSEALL